MLLALIHNASLLIALAYVFGLAMGHRLGELSLARQVVLGVAVAVITLSVMYARWELQPGVAFDTRSVSLAISGLFFGVIPTGIAMVAAVAYRLFQGGLGMPTGIGVILASGGIGLVWRHARQGMLAEVRVQELFAFGLVVHVVTLLMFLLLPAETAQPILKIIFWPVLLVYPLATVVLGKLLAHHLLAKRGHARLEESEARYRSLFENEHTVMLIVDPKTGRIEAANPAAEIFYGWTEDELTRMPLADLCVGQATEVQEILQHALTTQQQHFFGLHRLADGAVRHVEYYIGPVKRDGRMLLCSIVHDITEQKTLEAQFRQAQKMEAVGRLAGGVAHDFNNKLQAMLGYTELALQRDLPETVRDDLEEIKEAALHSAELTRHLLAFARKQPSQPQVLDLNESITRMLRMLQRMIGNNIVVHWNPCEDGWPVHIDPTQLDQILTNLVVNSRDAMGNEGHLCIETQNIRLDASYTRQHAYAKPGDYVMLAIADTGKGMSKETMDQIFEPFFTTKELAMGTGLGLSTVYGIVKQNNGFVHAYSEEGVGTTMKIYLPRTREAGATMPEKYRDAEGEVSGGPETILIAEDEWAVLELIRSVLQTAGYTVIGSNTPNEALRLAETYPAPIHLLLTDVIMPGMNGKQLAKKVTALHPDAHVVYMSGFTAEAITYRGLLDKDADFLQKPFSVVTLKQAVREVLDRQPAAKVSTNPA